MKRLKRLSILLVLTILTIVALAHFGDVELNADTLSQVHWGWLIVVVVIFYSTIVVRGTRWHRVLRAMGYSPSLIYTSTLMVAGLFISAILPARLGDIGRVALLKQDYKIPISQGLASIATERALDIFSILILAITGSLLALQGRMPTEYLQLMIFTAILFVIGLVGLLAMPSLERWLRNPFPQWQKSLWLGQPSNNPTIKQKLWQFYQKILGFGFSMIHGVRALGKNPVALTIALLESLYIWFGDALLLHFSLVSIKATVSLGITLFSMMVGDLFAAVPITPGAIGQFEVAVAGILTVLGVDRADSTLAAILLRLVSLWTLIPVSGLITYLFGFSRLLDLNPQMITATAPVIAEESASPPQVSSPTPLEG